MKHKSDSKASILKLIDEANAQGKPIYRVTTIRCDQGGEFLKDELQLSLRERGIAMQLTSPDSSKQNGMAERRWRTLVENGRFSFWLLLFLGLHLWLS